MLSVEICYSWCDTFPILFNEWNFIFQNQILHWTEAINLSWTENLIFNIIVAFFPSLEVLSDKEKESNFIFRETWIEWKCVA